MSEADITIRDVSKDDVHACYDIEVACFSETAAASMEKIEKRATIFPQGFLVALGDGKVIGFINSGATDKPDLADEEFKNMVGHDGDGKNIVILSIAVAPSHQGRGISRLLMEQFIDRARVLRKQTVLLLCRENMIGYYEKFGYADAGVSASIHGGGRWHEMRLDLKP